MTDSPASDAFKVTDDTVYYGPCSKCGATHGGWESCRYSTITPGEAKALLSALLDEDVDDEAFGTEHYKAFARGFAKLSFIAEKPR